MKNKLEPGKAYILKGQYFEKKYGIGAKAYIEDTTENILGKDWIEQTIPVVVVFIQRYIQYDLNFKQTYYAKVTRLGEVTGGLGEIITSDDIIPEQEIAKMRDDIIKNEISNSNIGQRLMEEMIDEMYDEQDDPFTGF